MWFITNFAPSPSPSCAARGRKRRQLAGGPGSAPHWGTTIWQVDPVRLAEALGQLEPEPANQDALRLIGNGHAAKPDASAGAGGQDHVTELDPGQLVDDGSGAATQIAASHPLRQRLPHRISQEAEEDVSLETVLVLMPTLGAEPIHSSGYGRRPPPPSVGCRSARDPQLTNRSDSYEADNNLPTVWTTDAMGRVWPR